MPGPPYHTLRIILGILSALTAIGGIVIIFSSRQLIVRLFLRPPESEVSALLLIALKEMGGLVLILSVMLFFAYRDPARNIAIVNAFIVGLCILAFTPLWSLYTRISLSVQLDGAASIWRPKPATFEGNFSNSAA